MIHNSNGSIALTAVFTSAAVAAMLAGALQWRSHRVTQFQIMRVVDTREKIVDQIESAARSPIALWRAAAANSSLANLRACLVGQTVCQAENSVEFAVSAGNNAQLGGTTANPAYFAVGGAPCGPNQALCPVKAVTKYSVSCPGGAASCLRPSGVSISYTVAHNSSSTIKLKQALAPKSGSVVVSVFQCPQGQVVFGFAVNGEPLCTVIPRSWVGIQGVQGPVGATGPQGPNGLTGDTGANGTVGARGDDCKY